MGAERDHTLVMPFTVSSWAKVEACETVASRLAKPCLVNDKVESARLSEWKMSVNMGSYMWMTEWRHDMKQILAAKDLNAPLRLVVFPPHCNVSSDTPMLIHNDTAHELLDSLQSKRHLVLGAVACNKLRARHLEVYDAWIVALTEAGESGGIIFY